MIWSKLIANNCKNRLNTVRQKCCNTRRHESTQVSCEDAGTIIDYTSFNARAIVFGICFDIDGVLVRGLVPFAESVKAFRLLCNSSNGQLKVPTVFLTNSFSLNANKAKWLSECLHVQVSPDQVVQAHTPIGVFNSLKNKNCLVIGQGLVADIAKYDLGIEHVFTIEEISRAYPLLDVVDNEKRLAVAKLALEDCDDLPIIEAILICGEPIHWETPLQLLIDLLLTSGRPSCHSIRSYSQTLPLIVCNPDLHYMGCSHIPRFGNGAFLLCLEALFKLFTYFELELDPQSHNDTEQAAKPLAIFRESETGTLGDQKVTGSELTYTAIVGKPSEISYRFAEHCLTEQSRRLFDNPSPLKTLYMIGDNVEVDILGANLYKRYTSGALLPASRTMPGDAELHPQTVTTVVPILVSTGVHNSNALCEVDDVKESGENRVNRYCQSHRDFAYTDKDLFQPVVSVGTVYDAVQYILKRESCV